MVTLDNSKRRLMEGLVHLLRDKVDGYPTVSGDNFNSTENVWPSSVPTKANGTDPKAFPYATVDVISGSDFDLSVELDAKLRENTVKVVVFGEESGTVEDLIEESEDAIADHWDDVAESPRSDWTNDTYLGDWSYRSTDGFTELVENEETEGKLRYNRSVDMIVETVKTTDNY